MKPNLLTRYPAILLLLLPALATAPTEAAADRAATQPADRPPPIPIVYTHYGRRTQLTPERTALILRTAEQRRPDRQEIWFVGVRYIGPYEVWASVFYAPEQSTPRLRKGRFADLRIARQSSREQGKLVWSDDDRVTSVEVKPYVQVSPTDRPFSGDRPEVPPPAYVPMPPPSYPRILRGDQKVEPLTDDELVRLVDFARAALYPKEFSPDEKILDPKLLRRLPFKSRGLDEADLKELGLSDEQIKQLTPRSHDGDDPICSIVFAAPDLFGVAAGVSDWGGEYVHVKRKDGGGFEVVGSGGWADADTIWWPNYDKRLGDGAP